MKKILVVIGTYLPGYRAGGPVRSVKNMVDFLGKEYEFLILTTDRDLGDSEPYQGIARNKWNWVEGARVYYVEPGGFTKKAVLEAARGADFIFVCGCFNDYARKVLWLHKRKKLKQPVIVAAMGLFSPGAFQIKRIKKAVYMKILRACGVLCNITWSATSDEEIREIKKVAGEAAICRIAADLPRKTSGEYIERNKEAGKVRIIFLSRITLKKNLSYALDILKTIKGQVQFDVYGPIQDMAYWKECEEKIRHMPSNVICRYQGNVHTDKVEQVFSQYHMFLFPTRGENYGHVIAEAMSAGCVPVISDRTPWQWLDGRGAGFVVKLEDITAFREVVQRLTDMGEEYSQYRKNACQAAREGNGTEENLQMYRELFQ